MKSCAVASKILLSEKICVPLWQEVIFLAKMSVELPKDFVRLMHEHYDKATADALCEALDTTEPEVSIRLNPRKLSVEEVLAHNPGLEPVPWCLGAFYFQQRPAFTFDPLLHAGAYYVQEASSMFVAEILKQFVPSPKPLVALDLCAAPGGKSTLLQSLLPEGSLLISNEPVAKRAQVLSENMQKWMLGLPAEAPQVIVTQNYPADFGALTGQVDILLVDAPCSGEGMFRKDEQARQEWSLENVQMCQQRQRQILSDIWHVLKPGGLLIYSTCTFNRYEDEDNTCFICDEMGASCLFERHFLPGRDRGEGFYLAAIRKSPPADPDPLTPFRGNKEPLAFLEGDKGLNKLGLRILFSSSDLFTPPKGGWGVRVDLSYSQALQYLRREALRIEAPRGPVTLCYRGLMLGPGKGVGNRINNLYPENWRIRTTYTTPFSLLEMVN